MRLAVWRLSTVTRRPSRVVWTSSPSQWPVVSSWLSTPPSAPSVRSKAWDALAQRLGGGPAVERRGAVVPGADGAVRLTDDQRLVGEVHQLGLVAQLRLGLAARGVGAVEDLRSTRSAPRRRVSREEQTRADVRLEQAVCPMTRAASR